MIIIIIINETLKLKYYDEMNGEPLSNLLRQASIRTENQLMVSLIIFRKIVKEMKEVQDHILSLIKVDQLTMSHMLQDQLLNQAQKVSTMQHATQEQIQHIS